MEMLKPILTFHMAKAGDFSINCKQFDTNHFDVQGTNQKGLTKEEAFRYCRIYNISIKNIVPSVYYDKTTTFTNLVLGDTVQCDTLWGISRKFGVSVDYLVRKNGIRDRNLIYVGEIIRV